MDRARHARAKELFLAARELPARERDAYLDRESQGDAGLRADVASLLANDSESFLGAPPFPLASAEPPTVIGSFRILGLLGEGGMGTVYRAEQEEPRREVALKVVRPGLASPSTLRRFQNEVELLGKLDHPGIARIYQAGTSGEQPFFAMELVSGQSLMEATKTLDVRARVELLVQVCDAVQHAHTRGIVHRDLKPENILIDDSGDPKVLDFGVARVVDPELATAFTRTGLLIGTLSYLSPEQAAGTSHVVDPRTDVYSLGVIGYELLARRMPYDLEGTSLIESVRVIRETEPTPLGGVSPSLAGDLQTIFARALEKDAERRYATVADFASDLGRYLRDEPVHARPLGRFARAARWIRRHRTLAIAIGIALTGPVFAALGQAVPAYLALAAGLVGTGVGLVRATTARRAAEGARKKAEREAEKATAILDFLRQMLGSADPRQLGANVKVSDVLEQARRELPGSFPTQPDVEGALHLTLGRTYFGLAMYDDARSELELALDLCTQASGPYHEDSLNSLGWLSILLREQGKQAEAEPLQTRLVELRREHLGPDHPETLLSLGQLALIHRALGRMDEAITLHREVIEGLKRTLGELDPETCIAMGNLAGLLSRSGNREEAKRLLRHVVPVLTETRGAEHPDTLGSTTNLSSILYVQGEYEEAEAMSRASYEGHRRVYGGDHPATMYARLQLARVLNARKQFEEGELLLAEAKRGFAAVFDASHEANQLVTAAYEELARARASGELSP